MRVIIGAAMITLAASAALLQSAGAQNADQSANTPPPKSCQGEEYRQLDFWVGEWDLWYSQGPDKPKAWAENAISKSAYGDCVITEKFSMPGFTGMSVSTFHKQIGQWRQTWVDDQGNYFDLVGGPAPKDADHDFGLESVHPQEFDAPYLRMIWTVEDADHLIWQWQGHKPGETVWKDLWVLHYVRKGAQKPTED